MDQPGIFSQLKELRPSKSAVKTPPTTLNMAGLDKPDNYPGPDTDDAPKAKKRKRKAENITEDYLLRQHEKNMRDMLQMDGPNDPRSKKLGVKSKVTSDWYSRIYQQNREDF